MTDAGVKNIKDLSSLMVLNLSQNCNLTDKTLELISGTAFKLVNSSTFLYVARQLVFMHLYRFDEHNECSLLLKEIGFIFILDL